MLQLASLLKYLGAVAVLGLTAVATAAAAPLGTTIFVVEPGALDAASLLRLLGHSSVRENSLVFTTHPKEGLDARVAFDASQPESAVEGLEWNGRGLPRALRYAGLEAVLRDAFAEVERYFREKRALEQQNERGVTDIDIYFLLGRPPVEMNGQPATGPDTILRSGRSIQRIIADFRTLHPTFQRFEMALTKAGLDDVPTGVLQGLAIASGVLAPGGPARTVALINPACPDLRAELLLEAPAEGAATLPILPVDRLRFPVCPAEAAPPVQPTTQVWPPSQAPPAGISPPGNQTGSPNTPGTPVAPTPATRASPSAALPAQGQAPGLVARPQLLASSTPPLSTAFVIEQDIGPQPSQSGEFSAAIIEYEGADAHLVEAASLDDVSVARSLQTTGNQVWSEGVSRLGEPVVFLVFDPPQRCSPGALVTATIAFGGPLPAGFPRQRRLLQSFRNCDEPLVVQLLSVTDQGITP